MSIIRALEFREYSLSKYDTGLYWYVDYSHNINGLEISCEDASELICRVLKFSRPDGEITEKEVNNIRDVLCLKPLPKNYSKIQHKNSDKAYGFGDEI